ncbi:unnamed protein product [Agarophyton chilense]|eukprot:gb/GEZJ01002588.1/.p1 GENE.gb/GEZJ01002588.1/~~gb/GEZJ01002588.1/.p1  ORF type:complete len:299 (-),score=32.71 gb/GEZJ01002588.1/:34-930(-)
MPFARNTLIANEYKVIRKVGDGGEGCVYHVKGTNGAHYAMKAARGHGFLRKEYEMYWRLGCVGSHTEFFPTIYSYTIHGEHDVLIMSILDESLESLKDNNRGRLSMRNVLLIGVELIKIIQQVHSKGILHLDLKPANIMLRNVGNRRKKVNIIDFGCARLFIDPRSGRHIPAASHVSFDGSPVFAPKRGHLSRSTSRRDDLESIGYVLVHLAKGQLPWEDIAGQTWEEEFERMGRVKMEMSLEDVCVGTAGIHEFLQEVSSTVFRQKPNYCSLIQKLEFAIVSISGASGLSSSWLEKC